MRPVLPLLLVAGLVLAGCSDGPKAKDDGVLSALEDVEVDTTATTGAIRGVVVDDAIRPLAGVNVTLAPGDLTTLTDDAGQFVFEGLPPAVYFVAVHAFGYADSQSSVDVVAGAAASVRVLMNAVYTPVPLHQVHHYEGFMQAFVSFASYAVELVAPGTTGCQCTFTLDPDEEGLTTFIYEADGDVTVENPAPVYGTIYWEFVGNPQTDIRSAHGKFPVYEVFERNSFDAATEDWTVRLTGSQWVHANQKFDLYVTTWYNMVPPEGWSFVNGDT